MGEKAVNGPLLEKWRNAFDAFDYDCDGFIELDVIGQAIRAIGCNPTEQEIADMEEDADGAALNFSTFVYLAYRHWRYVDAERELVNTFRLFDRTRSGRLPADTVRKIFRNATRPFSEAQIEDIMRHCTGEDGSVNYSEMVRIVLS